MHNILYSHNPVKGIISSPMTMTSDKKTENRNPNIIARGNINRLTNAFQRILFLNGFMHAPILGELSKAPRW
jgi:hypothetical protein